VTGVQTCALPICRHAARFAELTVGILHGTRSYVLQDADGQIRVTHSISAGLDYSGVGPEHSYYHDRRRIEYTSVTDAEALELALIENLQREDLNPMEEARAYERLSEQFGHTQQEIADKVGRDRATVANTLRLLSLPASIQDLVKSGQLTEGHARALLSLPSSQDQTSLAQKIIARKFSVRQTDVSTPQRFAAVATSISRAAAPAFAKGSHDPRTLELPPVPCKPNTGLKYAGAAGANSVRIFFQSRSSSSARIMGSAVEIPWPISDLSISSVT
jgi:hypothetical protein